MAKTKKDESTFEKDLEGLEGIVSALEEGGLSLDDALKRFEDGVKLARKCEKALTEAEKKIEILMKNADGDTVAEPFDASEDTPAAAATEAPKAASRERDDEPPIIEPPEEDEDELLF